MSVKSTKIRHYLEIVNRAADRCRGLTAPKEGWIATFRKSRGMSGAQLAAQAGLTRAAIYQAQRNELAESITLRQIQKLANAMGGTLVYGIVPQSSQLGFLQTQAERRAQRRFARTASASPRCRSPGVT